ncbi:MAG: hypothetical protein MRZ94_05735 [Oscillospiraceae bacterium]|nr:hypothetical protein [Oscillospiraceae bacterium]
MTIFDVLFKVSALFKDGRIKESREYYHECTEDVPALAETVEMFERLLTYIPKDITGRYSMEFQSIRNLLEDYKEKYYYERIGERGVSLITTTGEKIDYILSDIVIKVAENKPSAEEKIRNFDKDIFPKITDDFE